MSSEPVTPRLLPTPRRPSDLEPPRPVVIVRSVARRLPTPLTSLVGREAEVAAACTMLVDDGVRLLTLTGPGGVGKTRLALRIAEETAATFSDGVVFVPLAPITDPDLVLPAIARELGLRETAAQSTAELLANHLRHRRLLLVLDNVEQVVAAAPYVAALLGGCPGLTVLATSRTRIHVSGEHRFPVWPLAVSVSEVGSRKSEEVGQNLRPPTSDFRPPIPPAVQLFVERAQAVEPQFILDADNAQTVAAICRRLDGLPLAIELAAVRIAILTPKELLARLGSVLPMLTDGPADAPDRLRTMRNAIAWSYDLLTPAEQTLLRRLSVFVGGCTLAAAETVVAEPATMPSFLKTIATLVDASLVRRHDEGEQTRFTMLETIREFALEHLASSGEMAEIASRHAAWSIQLAEGVRRLGALSRRQGLDELETEHPNLRAALGWLLRQGEATEALHLAGELAEFWFRRGHLAEGIAWLEQALSVDDVGPTAARANALVGLSMLNWPYAVDSHAQTHENASGDATDSFARPVRLLDEAEAVARAAGDAGALAYARLHQGYVAVYRGDFDLADARGSEGIETVAAIPQGFSLHPVHWLLAEVALAREDDGQAQEHFARLLALARAGGDEVSQANALGGLARLAERHGEPGVALRGFAEAAAVCRVSGDRLHAGLRLEQAATTATAIGRTASAARLLAAADSLRVVAGLGTIRVDARLLDLHQQTLLTVRTALGDEPFAAHWAAGAALSLDEAIAEIHALADHLSAGTPADLEARPAALTAREGEVLLLLADGLGDKQIAMTLGISRRTASQHVAAILTKLEAESRTAAVSRALRQGLLGASPAEST